MGRMRSFPPFLELFCARLVILLTYIRTCAVSVFALRFDVRKCLCTPVFSCQSSGWSHHASEGRSHAGQFQCILLLPAVESAVVTGIPRHIFRSGALALLLV